MNAANKSLKNRLCSISHDAQFVQFISSQFPLQILSNERSGSWYVNPTLSNSCYFKSTDGHYSQWDFNLRRHNLHVLKSIHETSGVIIVDTTRKGKRFPDSLSKTIPIWIAVLNRSLLKLKGGHWDTRLHLPLFIPDTEKAQIEALMDGWVQQLLESPLDLTEACRLQKPMRPIFVAPDSRMFLNLENEPFWTREQVKELPFIPIVLVSCSMSETDLYQKELDWVCPKPVSFTYVQGAADDAEAWGHGLTSALYWSKLSGTNFKDLSDLECERLVQDAIESPMEESLSPSNSKDFDFIGKTRLAIGSRKASIPPTCWDHFDLIINCGAPEFINIQDGKSQGQEYLYLNIPEGKKGQSKLIESIPHALEFVKRHLNDRILIHCMQGRDRSVGISMAILLTLMTENGTLESSGQSSRRPILSKEKIRDMLLFISNHHPTAMPSRATLTRLNSYFIPRDFS